MLSGRPPDSIRPAIDADPHLHRHVMLDAVLAGDVDHANRHAHHAFGMIGHRHRHAAHCHVGIADCLDLLDTMRHGERKVIAPDFSWASSKT